MKIGDFGLCVQMKHTKTRPEEIKGTAGTAGKWLGCIMPLHIATCTADHSVNSYYVYVYVCVCVRTCVYMWTYCLLHFCKVYICV